MTRIRRNGSWDAISARRVKRRLVVQGRRVSFWTAIVLPFLSLPLVLSGIGTSSELLALLALVVVNAIAALLGHDYRPSRPADATDRPGAGDL